MQQSALTGTLPRPRLPRSQGLTQLSVRRSIASDNATSHAQAQRHTPSVPTCTGKELWRTTWRYSAGTESVECSTTRFAGKCHEIWNLLQYSAFHHRCCAWDIEPEAKLTSFRIRHFQRIFSNKMYAIRLKFHWSLFLRVQFTIFWHWLR